MPNTSVCALLVRVGFSMTIRVYSQHDLYIYPVDLLIV